MRIRDMKIHSDIPAPVAAAGSTASGPPLRCSRMLSANQRRRILRMRPELNAPRTQLRNSRASSLLNLLGLTIALSSFIILIAQVRYELTYDTHFRDADRIFRIEIDVPTELGVYSPLLCRPLGERMLASSPDIEAGGVMAIPRRVSVHDFAKGEEDGAGLTLYRISRSMFDVLGTEIVAGDIDRFDDPQ